MSSCKQLLALGCEKTIWTNYSLLQIEGGLFKGDGMENLRNVICGKVHIICLFPDFVSSIRAMNILKKDIH